MASDHMSTNGRSGAGRNGRCRRTEDRRNEHLTASPFPATRSGGASRVRVGDTAFWSTSRAIRRGTRPSGSSSIRPLARSGGYQPPQALRGRSRGETASSNSWSETWHRQLDMPGTPQYVPLPIHGWQGALLRPRADERPNHPARRATDRKGRAMRTHEVSRCLGGIGRVTQRQQRHRGPRRVGAHLSRVRAPGEIADLLHIDVLPTDLTAESIGDGQCRGAPIATVWGYGHL